jgi:hypothetical protein
MRPFWSRFLRHAAFVGVSLAVIGYLLGKAFLTVHRIYSGGAYNPENERVLWQTPLVMAAIGIGLTAVLELLTGMLRKPAPVGLQAVPPSNPGS